jgi:two-component system KDP operon response regulator KdpE
MTTMTDATAHILIVEDEADMRRFLEALLVGHGYRVIEAALGREGLVEVATRNPDVILLDLGLPDMDGLEFTRRVREESQVPIIVISARGQEKDKIDALDLGADDYLTKPFDAGELLARVRVALRRASWQRAWDSQPEVSVGPLRVDLAARQVTRDGAPVHLTRLEYKLLAVLVQNAGKVLTHRHILKAVWGPAYVDHTHYVRVYMAQLRQKVEADPSQPRYLITETGVGYRLRAG